MLGHGFSACPELVYVPTGITHPSLPSGEQRKLARGIDLLPTVLDALSKKPEAIKDWDLSGKSLLANPGQQIIAGHTHFEREFRLPGPLPEISRIERSIWTPDGGHVFVESSKPVDTLLYCGLLIKTPQGRLIRNKNSRLKSFSHFVSNYLTYGTPRISRQEAYEYIEKMGKVKGEEITLSEGSKDQLRDLGYLVD